MTDEKLWDDKYEGITVQETLERVNHVETIKIGRVLRECVPAYGRVLEAGSGTGRILNFVISKCEAFGVGLDYSPEGNQLALATSRALGARAGFVTGDLRFMPFPNNAFDAVFSDSVIEHLYETELAVEEMARVVKRGGLVIVTTPNKLRPDGWDLYRRRNKPPYLQKSFTPRTLRRMFAGAGLEVVSFFGDTLLLTRNFRRKRSGANAQRSGSPVVFRLKAPYQRVERLAERFWPAYLWVNLGVIGRKR